MEEEQAPPVEEPSRFMSDSVLHVENLLSVVLEEVARLIHEKELLSHLSEYLYCETMLPLHAMFQAQTLAPSLSLRISQEPESEVPKISIDSIAPKEMKRERRLDDSKDHSAASPKSNQSKLKRRFSRISPTRTTQPPFSPAPKLKPRPQIISLAEAGIPQNQQREMPEEAVLRRQKNYELSQRTRQVAEEKLREKRLLEAREKVESTYANGYTFDLDGSVLRSEMVDTDKMNVHTIRLNLNRTDRLKVRQRNQIAQQTIELKSSRRKEQHATIDVSGLTLSPKFVQQPQRLRSNNSKYASMRRQQYSQAFGNRYSPWINRPHSKGASLSHDTSQESMELVAGQRKSRIVSGTDHSLTHRPGSTILESKFTLPKLRGRYNLLDKYATVDASGTITTFN